MKSRLSALSVILLIIFSQIVLAQNSDFRTEERFEDDRGEIRTEFRDDNGKVEFRQEFRDDDGRFEERYEFEEKRDYRNEPDFGPRYENKEEMLFGRLFHLIEDDINEFEMMKLCGTPDRIADVVIDKVKGRIGDISNACSDIEEEEIECREHVTEGCSHIGQPDLRYARDEREKKEMQAYACPPNRDLIVELCVDNSMEWIDDRLQYLEEDCEFEWQQYGGARDTECERLEREQFCEESKFIEQCLDRHKPFQVECPDIRPPHCPNGYT